MTTVISPGAPLMFSLPAAGVAARPWMPSTSVWASLRWSTPSPRMPTTWRGVWAG